MGVQDLFQLMVNCTNVLMLGLKTIYTLVATIGAGYFLCAALGDLQWAEERGRMKTRASAAFLAARVALLLGMFGLMLLLLFR